MSKIASMWVYPWDLVDETPTAVVARAKEMGLNGLLNEPKGVVLVTLPTGEVGENCPLVNP